MTALRAIGVATLAVLTTATLAHAHAGNNDPSLVHACRQWSGQAVRIVGLTGSCRAGEVAVHVPRDRQGLEGAQGKQGPVGPQGPHDPPGENAPLPFSVYDANNVRLGGVLALTTLSSPEWRVRAAVESPGPIPAVVDVLTHELRGNRSRAHFETPDCSGVGYLDVAGDEGTPAVIVVRQAGGHRPVALFVTTIPTSVYTRDPRPLLTSNGPRRSTLSEEGACTPDSSASLMHDVVPTIRMDLGHLVPPFTMK